MALISKLSLKDLVDLQEKIAVQAGKAAVLEDAAQEYMSILYETLSESIILARFFATVYFKELPETNKKFVINLARSAGISDSITDQTLVLSLLGSRGAKPEWNDRRNSQGHIGIPLVSSDFIDSVPMVSRLLEQLGGGISWIDAKDTQIVSKTFKKLSGVFHVRDAATEVDSKGRKIVISQDFVEKENVKTVFSIGGCYLGTPLFFATIIFVREFLGKNTVGRFMLQASKFKIATMNIVQKGKIFA